MNNEQIIINNIKEKLAEVLIDYTDLQIISSQDFSNLEERSETMVVIGITEKNNVNPYLPDYKYIVNVVVNTFIADDDNAEKFNQIYSLVENSIRIGIFDSPVIGLVYNDISFSEDGESHIANLQYDVYTSEQA